MRHGFTFARVIRAAGMPPSTSGRMPGATDEVLPAIGSPSSIEAAAAGLPYTAAFQEKPSSPRENYD
jgi:hypothetical protein